MATVRIEREGDSLDLNISNDRAEGLMIELFNEKYKGNGQEEPVKAQPFIRCKDCQYIHNECDEAMKIKPCMSVNTKVDCVNSCNGNGEGHINIRPNCYEFCDQYSDKEPIQLGPGFKTEEPSKPLTKKATKIEQYKRGHPKAEAIQRRVIELFKEDMIPKVVRDIIKEEFNVDVKIQTIYYWKKIIDGKKEGYLYGLNKGITGPTESKEPVEKKEMAERPPCIHCDSKRIKKDGKQRGKQRWKCLDCDKVFVITSGPSNKAREQVEALLRRGKKPMEAKAIVEKEFGIKLKKATLYYWVKTMRKEEASSKVPPAKVPVTPKPKKAKPPEPATPADFITNRLIHADNTVRCPRNNGGKVEQSDCEDCNYFVGNHSSGEDYFIQCSSEDLEEAAPEQGGATPTPTENPREPEPPEEIYDSLKTVQRKPYDLMIINGEVMCPKASGAIVCKGLGKCNKYVATLLVDGESHVRCTAAGD